MKLGRALVCFCLIDDDTPHYLGLMFEAGTGKAVCERLNIFHAKLRSFLKEKLIELRDGEVEYSPSSLQKELNKQLFAYVDTLSKEDQETWEWHPATSQEEIRSLHGLNEPFFLN